jgi:hypothetical protein
MLCKEKLKVTYFKLFTRKVIKDSLYCADGVSIFYALKIGLQDHLGLALVLSLTV